MNGLYYPFSESIMECFINRQVLILTNNSTNWALTLKPLIQPRVGTGSTCNRREHYGNIYRPCSSLIALLLVSLHAFRGRFHVPTEKNPLSSLKALFLRRLVKSSLVILFSFWAHLFIL